ncbi:MAG: hypothetical protein J6W42_01245 [Bacteroidaceae bacterium]|nr:hypothetical protein [Bacteroidaceae bacterium]
MRKSVFTVAAAIMMATCVLAQDIPADMRMEIIESEDDSRDQYTIFKYKEKNGNTGYYMGVGNKIELLGLVRDDITDMSISHMDEVCLPMGSTRQEVIDNLDSYLELLGKPAGTTVEFPCRIDNYAGLGEESKTTCIVTKRFLQGKRLCFHFTSGNRTAKADLRKSSVKSMKLSVKLDIKLHPNKD